MHTPSSPPHHKLERRAFRSFQYDQTSYADDLRKKVAEFVDETQAQKSVWLVMVSVFGLANSPYDDLVQKNLSVDTFF